VHLRIDEHFGGLRILLAECDPPARRLQWDRLA
jgi:hypothetical protein